MTLTILWWITLAISTGAAAYLVYLIVPLTKAYWDICKAEAEEEIRLKKAAAAIQNLAEKIEDE